MATLHGFIIYTHEQMRSGDYSSTVGWRKSNDYRRTRHAPVFAFIDEISHREPRVRARFWAYISRSRGLPHSLASLGRLRQQRTLTSSSSATPVSNPKGLARPRATVLDTSRVFPTRARRGKLLARTRVVRLPSRLFSYHMSLELPPRVSGLLAVRI
jgi:hypothetical protein